MDKTAKIWHVSRSYSLVSFVHGDFVTSAVFHPQDDRFFLSGSLDGKLRLWNISAKKVQCSQEVPGLITACAFTESGNTACVGTFAGHALFYQTDGLTYSSSIAVRSPSGKCAKGGRKITSIEPIVHTSGQVKGGGGGALRSDDDAERVLITSNDSRIRAYDLKSKSMVARFKAKTYTNRTSQIRANISGDNLFIVAGSEATSNHEGGHIHIWDSHHALLLNDAKKTTTTSSSTPSPLTSDSAVEYFTAHSGTVTCAIMAPLLTNTHLKSSNDHIVVQSEKKMANGKAGGGSLLGPLSPIVPNSLKFNNSNGESTQSPVVNQRWNRIIVSVDESAVVRVWRSDSLDTVHS
jgi:hypothetical protein